MATTIQEISVAPSSVFAAADGDGYELQMGRWSRRLAPHFIKYAGLSGGGSILDVGCGTGSLTFALAAEPGITSVTGIDFSPVYVAHAAAHNNDPRIRFETGDACALACPDASFDHSLSQLVLHFIPDPERAVREMRRVTRPGGVVCAAVWDSQGGFVSQRMFWDTAAMLDPEADVRRGKGYSRPITQPGALAKAWREAGLANVEDGMITIRMDFASFEDFWKPAEGRDGPTAEYTKTLGPDATSRLREALRRAYLGGAQDGPRSYASTAWVAKGIVPG
jgi:SAM-dependent methyltransferase